MAFPTELDLIWPSAPVVAALLSTGLLRRWLQQRIEQLLLQTCSLPLEPDHTTLEALRQAWLVSTPSAEWPLWCRERSLESDCLDALACDHQLELLKRRWFAEAARAAFLSQGAQLDRVCFSLLQTADAELAQEWFFKLKDGESSFSLLAKQSLGSEKTSGGRIGPIQLNSLQQPLKALLERAPRGVVQPPLLTPSGRTCIVRLDTRSPAQWEGDLEHVLIEQHYQAWLEIQINRCIREQPKPGDRLSLSLP